MEGFDFNEVTQKVKDVAGDIRDKANDTLDKSRIRSQIHSLQRDNDRDYMQIGKMVYEKYKNEESVDGDLTDLCSAIADRDEQIEEQQGEIDKING